MTTSETVTTAVAAVLVPPGPEQVSEYDTLAENGPMACVPLPATPPLQPSEAVQEVALLELHVKVDDPPVGTTEGAAANVAVGTMLTVTLAVELVPPPPVHTNEKVVAPVSAAEVCVPLVASVPVQPPEAAQELALVELHVRVADSPLLTVVFETLSVAVGGGGPDPPPQSATRNAKKMPAHDLMDRMAPLFLVESYGVGLIVRHDRQRC